MIHRVVRLLPLMLLLVVSFACNLLAEEPSVRRLDGYMGIWFDLGQASKYGSKYSGGLATYTAKHRPMACYSSEAHKTFFVYGGTTSPDERHLLAMVSYYDHHTHQVPRPVVVHDKKTVNDPHDNPSICLDEKGHVWVTVSGRGRSRPGFMYRSLKPHSIDGFELIREGVFTYPQTWWVEGRGMMFMFTKYTNGRELYFANSDLSGKEWQDDRKLAGIGGHYQVSLLVDGEMIAAFNRHPNGAVDKRTDLYFLRSNDLGETWTTVDGQPVEIPLTSPDSPALVRDYSSHKRLVYVKDIALDSHRRPVILYVTSSDSKTGPTGDPREWTIAHWLDDHWEFNVITTSSHNYDMGSLYLESDNLWRVVAPTEPGPQKWGPGGVIADWQSTDQGKTWKRTKMLLPDTPLNHGYVRKPLPAHPDFYAFWADGNPEEFSPSHLYFTNQAADKVWRLPAKMEGEFATPEEVQSDASPLTEEGNGPQN